MSDVGVRKQICPMEEREVKTLNHWVISLAHFLFCWNHFNTLLSKYAYFVKLPKPHTNPNWDEFRRLGFQISSFFLETGSFVFSALSSPLASFLSLFYRNKSCVLETSILGWHSRPLPSSLGKFSSALTSLCPLILLWGEHSLVIQKFISCLVSLPLAYVLHSVNDASGFDFLVANSTS